MCETNQIWSFVRYFIISVTKSLACIYLKISCKSKCSIFCNYKDEINKGKLHMITIGWTFFCSCDQSFPNSKLIMPQFCLYPLDNDFFFCQRKEFCSSSLSLSFYGGVCHAHLKDDHCPWDKHKNFGVKVKEVLWSILKKDSLVFIIIFYFQYG